MLEQEKLREKRRKNRPETSSNAKHFKNPGITSIKHSSGAFRAHDTNETPSVDFMCRIRRSDNARNNKNKKEPRKWTWNDSNEEKKVI